MPDLLLSFPTSQLGAQMTPLLGATYFTVVEDATVKVWAIADKAAVIAAYAADPNFGGWQSLDAGDYTRRVLWTISITAGASPIVDTYASGVGFTGGVTTQLTLSQSPGTVNNTVVLFDGVVQQKATYTLAANIITFSSAIPLGVSVVEVTSNPLSIYPTVPGQSITMAKLATDVLPVGIMFPYGGAAAPSANWMLCDGTAISRTVYAALFAAIGTAYGVGDGATTFNLPDTRGRTFMGAGTGTYGGASARTVGQQVGAETHTLDVTQIPSHTHPNTFAGHSTTGGATGYSEANPTAATPNTGATGGGLAHNNMQPSLGCNFIIKVV